jgi:hypothetical protein
LYFIPPAFIEEMMIIILEISRIALVSDLVASENYNSHTNSVARAQISTE